MTKRYTGGVVSGEGPSSFNGFWSLSEQIGYKSAGTWPKLGPTKIGTSTYDATALGNYVHVDDLLADLSTDILTAMTDFGYLRYNIKTGTGTSKTITVAYTKTGATNFAQSAFSLFGQALQFTAATTSILLYSNDDHDTLAMDADGKGVIARTNTNIFTGNYDKFQGTTEVITNSTVDSVFNFAPSNFIGSSPATLISFPKTSSGVWLNLSSGSYRTNTYASATMPSALSVAAGSTSPTNSLYTISDGVNSFLIGRWSTGACAYCKVDLSTGIITASSIAVTNPSQSNVTEEDAFGTQLFTVDGRIPFHVGGIFYYGGTKYWRGTSPAFTSISGMSSLSVGNSTQTDMDIFGSVDTSGWLWFADWGHDDGGLFGVGNDSQLGTRPTNIRLVPDSYVN